MRIVHLTASGFFGGPERQMLGLASALPPEYSSTFLSFPEEGRCRPFLAAARAAGFDAAELANDAPNWRAAVRELTAADARRLAGLATANPREERGTG